jgi:hypothetical protein
MASEFRAGLLIGIAAIVAVVVYCAWLWQGERQVALHTEKLFRALEQKDWSSARDLIASDYRDQWNQDRALLLERTRLLLASARKFQINATEVDCRIDNGAGKWRGKVSIETNEAELLASVKDRLNALSAPFELQWRHDSNKPWDWKLIRVGNSELESAGGFE